jgi:hypothetical protein
MARQFKPARFFVMMAAAAFVVCGVTAFYTHRAAHGRTAEERADGSEVFQAAGVRRTAEWGPGLRERLHGRVQEDASSAVNRS